MGGRAHGLVAVVVVAGKEEEDPVRTSWSVSMEASPLPLGSRKAGEPVPTPLLLLSGKSSRDVLDRLPRRVRSRRSSS